MNKKSVAILGLLIGGVASTTSLALKIKNRNYKKNIEFSIDGLCINSEEGYEYLVRYSNKNDNTTGYEFTKIANLDEYLNQLTKDDVKRIKNKPSFANVNVFLKDILFESENKYEDKEFYKNDFKLEVEPNSSDIIIMIQRDIERFGLEDYITIDKDKVTVDLKILEVFSY